MPPLSPVPGCANGEVCSDRTASVRTAVSRSSVGLTGVPRRLPPDGAAYRHVSGTPTSGLRVAFSPERPVDGHQGALLVVVEVRIPADLRHQVDLLGLLVEDPGPDIERLGRQVQGLGDLAEDLGRRLAQPALDLA